MFEIWTQNKNSGLVLCVCIKISVRRILDIIQRRAKIEKRLNGARKLPTAVQLTLICISGSQGGDCYEMWWKNSEEVRKSAK